MWFSSVTFLKVQRQKIEGHVLQFYFLWNFLTKFDRVMRLEGKAILFRLKDKNRGNVKLMKAIDRLVDVLENSEINSLEDFRILRRDAEKVHNDGFYFVDIIIHRALLLVLIEESQVRIVWAGSHQEYERIFKNNKNSVEKWLKSNKLLQ